MKEIVKQVSHHDDPPCEARLKDGYCHSCKVHPDMQSTSIWYYCIECEIPLTFLGSRVYKCPACKCIFDLKEEEEE